MKEITNGQLTRLIYLVGRAIREISAKQNGLAYPLERYDEAILDALIRIQKEKYDELRSK